MAAALPSRRLHLIDIENLVGQARPTWQTVTAWAVEYHSSGLVGPMDLCVVACNHGAALEVGLAWRGSRLILRSGVNGADLALLDVIESEDPATRFPGIVLASGDGIFADAAAELGTLGVKVTVVYGIGKLSRRLEMAAATVMPLTIPALPVEAAVLRSAA